jgi:hypothetical protein
MKGPRIAQRNNSPHAGAGGYERGHSRCHLGGGKWRRWRDQIGERGPYRGCRGWRRRPHSSAAALAAKLTPSPHLSSLLVPLLGGMGLCARSRLRCSGGTRIKWSPGPNYARVATKIRQKHTEKEVKKYTDSWFMWVCACAWGFGL